MTFEEMQKIIERMLSVQRELKESQLKFEESQETQKLVLDKLTHKYGDLAEYSIRQREILDRLITIQNSNFKRRGDHARIVNS